MVDQRGGPDALKRDPQFKIIKNSANETAFFMGIIICMLLQCS
jgi:hypothetical protein